MGSHDLHDIVTVSQKNILGLIKRLIRGLINIRNYLFGLFTENDRSRISKRLFKNGVFYHSDTAE